VTAGTATGALRSLGPRVRRERRLMAARVPAGLTRYQASAIGADLVQRFPAYATASNDQDGLGCNAVIDLQFTFGAAESSARAGSVGYALDVSGLQLSMSAHAICASGKVKWTLPIRAVEEHWKARQPVQLG